MGGIQHNYDEFAVALKESPLVFENQVLRDLGQLIDTWYSKIATEDYMQKGPKTFGGDPPPRPMGMPGPLRRVSQRLARAVRGQFSDRSRESTTLLDVGSKGLVWTRIIAVPYAAIHEKGGRIRTTQKMENFFWYKYTSTTKEHWKNLALGAKANEYFNVPARPYSKPALKGARKILLERGSDILDQFISDVLNQ